MSWVELRVHGVSGTPPESLLGVPHVKQVAGDDFSRFFRPAGEAGADHVLEGYHWGRFTSGTWRQGLALLLVPFGLVNAAQFMLSRPHTRFERVMYLLAGTFLRVTALVLTALFTFTLGLIFIDIVAWRWATSSEGLGNLPVWMIVTGGALAAVLGVLGLALLGRAGGTRKPKYPNQGGTPGTTALDPAFFVGDPNALTMRALHTAAGLTVVALLVAFVRQAGDASLDTPVLPVVLLGLVAVVVALAGDPERTVTVGTTLEKGSPWDRIRPVIAWSLLGLSVILLVAEGWQTARDLAGLPAGETPEGKLSGFDHVANGIMVAAVLALGALHAANLFLVWRGPGLARWSRHDARVRAGLLVPGFAVAALILAVDTPLWVSIAAGAVLTCTVVLAVFAIRRWIAPGDMGPRADEYYFRPFAGGMTPFLLTTLSTFLGVGLSAAAANAVAAALPGVAASTDMLDRVGYAWGLTLFELAALGIIGLGLGVSVRHHFNAAVETGYSRPDGQATVLPEGWAGRVATSMAAAQGKNFLPVPIITFVAVGLLISGVQLFETYPSLGSVAGWLDWVSEDRSADGAASIIGLGTWLLLGAAGYVVAVSRGAISNRDLRRGINVVWDVFSFWPHAVHPFVPRPYSRWTVIELRNRIRWHLEQLPESGRRVVVAAHSQGSLIAYAALLLLEPHEQKRVAFLSCGSQLRVIYPRAFPAYVNLATHHELFDSLGGAWINLYRLTDPLAGPVLSWEHDDASSRHFPDALDAPADDQFVGEDRCRRCGNDWRLIDPIPHDADVETGAVAAIHGHSEFWGDPSWERALTALRAYP